MMLPNRRQPVESLPVAAAIRVYADTAAGPLILDVPHGQLTTKYVEQARSAGGSRVRIVALDRWGATIDRVVVR